MNKQIELLIACERLRVAMSNKSACDRYEHMHEQNKQAWKDMLSMSTGRNRHEIRN